MFNFGSSPSRPLQLSAETFACTMTLTIASIYCWVIFLQMAFLTIEQGIPSAIIITYSLGGWAQRNLQVVVVVEKVMINTLESIRIKCLCFHSSGPWENAVRTNVIGLQKRHGHGLSTVTFGYICRVYSRETKGCC